MNNDELLKIIIAHYLDSYDFNGIANYEFENYNPDSLIQLIRDGYIEAISETDVLNPHIKGFNLQLSKEHQINKVIEGNCNICFYPTELALKNINVDYSRPYTAMLQKGIEQFRIIYFNIEVLEQYINNPKYLIIDHGYRGQISIKDQYFSKETENEYIRDFGMAYITGNTLNRAVAVFAIDLSNLSQNVQLLWKSFELQDQSTCKVQEGFVKNLLFGEWVTQHWIFDAILDEMKTINNLCDSIGIPHLFRKTYGTYYNEKPEGYNNVLLPTSKNYYNFISVMEKLIVHNLSIKTFTATNSTIRAIDRQDDNGKDKGSLVMFKEWLDKNIRANFDIDDIIINPLKNIRKIRQIPAHELYNNEYNICFYEQQMALMHDIYSALNALRTLFMHHPLAKNVDIPEYLLDGTDIVFY